MGHPEVRKSPRQGFNCEPHASHPKLVPWYGYEAVSIILGLSAPQNGISPGEYPSLLWPVGIVVGAVQMGHGGVVQHRLTSPAAHHTLRVGAGPVPVVHADAADVGRRVRLNIQELGVRVALGVAPGLVKHVILSVLTVDVAALLADGGVVRPYLLQVPVVQVQRPHITHFIRIPLAAHPRHPRAHRLPAEQADAVVRLLELATAHGLIEKIPQKHALLLPGGVGEGKDAASGEEFPGHLPRELLVRRDDGGCFLPLAVGEVLQSCKVGVVAGGEVHHVS